MSISGRLISPLLILLSGMSPAFLVAQGLVLSASPAQAQNSTTVRLSCPVGQTLNAQAMIDKLLPQAEQYISQGNRQIALSQADLALKLAIDSKSAPLLQSTLQRILFGSLWPAITGSSDRLQRLDTLTQLSDRLSDLPVRAQQLIQIAKGYHSAKATPKVTAILNRVPNLLAPDTSLQTRAAVLLDSADLYIRLNQANRARPLIDRIVSEIKAAEPEVSPEQRVLLRRSYAYAIRGYALLGLPNLVEPLIKPSNQVEPSAWTGTWTEPLARVHWAIAHAKAKQTAKANQIFTGVIQANAEASEEQLLSYSLAYAQADQWTAAIQATQLIKDAKTKTKIRLELGSLAASLGQFDRAVAMGKLAAAHAHEAGSFTVGRDDVIQWLNSWNYYDRGTPEIIGVVEALELNVYDEIVVAVLRGAQKSGQSRVLDRALAWINQRNDTTFPNASVEAMLIHAQRQQFDAAFQTAQRSEDPYRNLAILARYFQQIRQPQRATQAKKIAMAQLSRQTFGDVRDITRVAVAIASMDVSAGKPQEAQKQVSQALKQAKSQLSAEAFSTFAQSLIEPLILTGHPALITQVVGQIPPANHVRLQELLMMNLAMGREPSSLVYRLLPVDQTLKALTLAIAPPFDSRPDFLAEIAALYSGQAQLNEAVCMPK
jgi:tetratricopeptide (TPR) repeat protein